MSLSDHSLNPEDDVKMGKSIPLSLKKKGFPQISISKSPTLIKRASFGTKCFMGNMALPNLIAVFGKIALMKNRILNRVKYSKLVNLTTNQRDLIKDFADSYLISGRIQDPTETILTPFNNFFFKKIGYVFQKFNEILPVLRVDHPILILTNILLFVLLTIKFITLSINLLICGETFLPYLNVVLVISLLFEIVLKFNSAYFKEGILIENRKKIGGKYLKSYFGWDLIAIFPLLLPYTTGETKPLLLQNRAEDYFLLLFFCKVPGLLKITEKLEENLVTHSSKLEQITPLLIMFLRAATILHILSCAWSFVAEVGENNQQSNWWEKTTINRDSWLEKYLWATYFMTTTLVSVGYGDITPQSRMEICLSIVTMSISCCFLGYFISNVNQLLRNINKSTKKKKEDIKTLTQILNRKKIDPQLQRKIIKYLVHIWKEEETERTEKKLNFVEKLNTKLKDEYLLQTNGKILKQCYFFSRHFSEETHDRLVHLMQPHRFDANEIILESGDISSEKIFIISEGMIELLIDSKKEDRTTAYRTLKTGDFFGELTFFNPCEVDFTARSITKSTVFTIERREFINVVKAFPQDYVTHNHRAEIEKFCMMRDKMHVYNTFEDLQINCGFCGENTHPITKCPYVNRNLTAHREKLQTSWVNFFKQKRATHNRRLVKYRWIASIKRSDKLKMKLFRKYLRTTLEQMMPRDELQTSKQDNEDINPNQIEDENASYKNQSSLKQIEQDNLHEHSKSLLKKSSIITDEPSQYTQLGTQCFSDSTHRSLNQNNNILFKIGFDRVKEYESYFPYNNVSIVLNFEKTMKAKAGYSSGKSLMSAVARSQVHYHNLLKFQKRNNSTLVDFKISSRKKTPNLSKY